jgi:hypothetical protein
MIHNNNLIGARQRISNFGGDIARSYLFSISMPYVFDERGGDTTTTTIFATSLDLPAYQLTSKQIQFQQMNINVVEGCTFSEFRLNVLEDDSSRIRTKLLAWAAIAYDYNRKGAASPKSYKRNLELNQHNIYGDISCKYTLFGAYPELVSGSKLDNNVIELSRFQVSFKYDFFTYKVYERHGKVRNFDDEMEAYNEMPGEDKPVNLSSDFLT